MNSGKKLATTLSVLILISSGFVFIIEQGKAYGFSLVLAIIGFIGLALSYDLRDWIEGFLMVVYPVRF